MRQRVGQLKKLSLRNSCIKEQQSGSQDILFLAAILKLVLKRGICANANMDIQIPDAVSFPKIYSSANLHEL